MLLLIDYFGREVKLEKEKFQKFTFGLLYFKAFISQSKEPVRFLSTTKYMVFNFYSKGKEITSCVLKEPEDTFQQLHLMNAQGAMLASIQLSMSNGELYLTSLQTRGSYTSFSIRLPG